MTTDAMATPTVQPALKGGISPYLNIEGASAASELYQRAFGAEEVSRMARPDDGRLIHCHLYINGASIMLSDPFPEHGYPAEVPAAFNLNINLGPKDDIDAWFKRAVDAGCAVAMPVEKMFWGDWYCQVRDPFGVLWAMNKPGA
jgi:uncharacterized glyoxalase superfamily protein PhnB